MTNVTLTLSVKEREELNQQMAGLFSNDTTQNGFVLESLLSDAEQVMLMKRVAAIMMLNARYSTYRIAQTLHLSHSTILRYKLSFLEGKYDAMLQVTQKKQFNEPKFWQLVETLLRAGMPKMAGPGRWKDLSPVRGTRPDLRRKK